MRARSNGYPHLARVYFCCVLAQCGVFLLLSAALPVKAEAPAGTTHQSRASQVAPKPRHRAHSTYRHHRSVKKPVETVASAPPAPPPPTPPADQPPAPANIQFRQGLLSIHAQNSSLTAILNQVSRQTGLVVEGLGQDKRIYGQYGPGTVSATLTTLLDGSGYNYVLLGGGTNGSPAKLILTPTGSAPGSAIPAATSNQPFTPAAGPNSEPTMVNPSEPAGAKTPQEIFNELRRMHPE